MLETPIVDPIMAIHIITGFGAIFIGIALFLVLKVDGNIKLRRFWQLTMLIMLFTSFDIKVLSPGSFSPIHGLSIIALVLILLEVWAGSYQRLKLERVAMTLSFSMLVLVLGAIVSTAGGVINQWFFA